MTTKIRRRFLPLSQSLQGSYLVNTVTSIYYLLWTLRWINQFNFVWWPAWKTNFNYHTHLRMNMNLMKIDLVMLFMCPCKLVILKVPSKICFLCWNSFSWKSFSRSNSRVQVWFLTLDETCILFLSAFFLSEFIGLLI